MIKVGMVRIKRPSKNRGELEGEWKCAATARMKQMRIIKVAMGWTTRMAERECRVPGARENLLLSLSISSGRVSANSTVSSARESHT